MHIEVLGFLAGVAASAIAGVLAVRHEFYKEISAIRGQDRAGRAATGNALIWPSH